MSDPLELMDSSADVVAGMTGIKQQLIDSGWSDLNAELLVIEMYRMATVQQQNKGQL